jgi:hypothetical protein
MDRFSHHKTASGPFLYEEFMGAAEKLISIVKVTHPTAHVEVLIREVLYTQPAPGSLPSLTGRSKPSTVKSYTLEQLTWLVWENALSVHLSINDRNVFQPFFAIYLMINREQEPRSLKFILECDDALMKDIRRHLGQVTPYYTIGDGYPVISDLHRKQDGCVIDIRRPSR